MAVVLGKEHWLQRAWGEALGELEMFLYLKEKYLEVNIYQAVQLSYLVQDPALR